MKIFLRAATITMIAAASQAAAAELNQATLTKIVNSVELIPPGAQPKAASLGETIRGQTGVRTGANSRAQLTFPDATLARLGANTLFSFARGTRMLDLENGAILLQVPKDAGGATIRSAPITAAITGTTLMMEYSPGNPGVVKIIVLEGTVRVLLKGRLGESVLINAGEMLTVAADARSLPDPVVVDVKRILRTSRLIKEGELEAMGLIVQTVDTQQQQLVRGKLGDAGPLLEGLTPDNAALQAASVLTTQNNRIDAILPPALTSAPPPPPPPPPPPQPAAAPTPAAVAAPTPLPDPYYPGGGGGTTTP